MIRGRVPAVLTVTDIAGLVRGAHSGAGLGNEFLSNIQAVDGICHVVRAFPSSKVTHVEGAERQKVETMTFSSINFHILFLPQVAWTRCAT